MTVPVTVSPEVFLAMGREVRAQQPFSVLIGAGAVHAGGTQAVCRCDVFVVKGGVETLCAVAHGTIAALARQDG